MTATTATAPARRLAPPVWRTFRFLGRTQAMVDLWFAAIIVLLWAGALVVWAQVGDVQQSIAQYSRQGATWFPFSIGISFVLAYHAAHIAAGMTRRALGTATVLLAVVNAATIGVLVTMLFAAERVLYRANGWAHVVVDAGWFPAEPSDLLAIFGWQTLVTLAGQVSGLLVATVYLRTSGWWGTLLLPLTAGPVFVVWWLGSRGVTYAWLTTGTRVGLSVLVVAAMATAFLALLRGLPVCRPRG